MKEMSKSIIRRQRESNFVTKYFVGNGIDIGGLPDPLSLYFEFFPLMKSVKIWDWNDGDAQEMLSIEDSTFDFVASSHCLEHLVDPFVGLKNWFRVLKPGGYLIVTIPEEDLYEQGTWPSNKNLDHKHSFTINKKESWSPKSINVLDLLVSLGESADIRKVSVEDSGYRYRMPEYDQTLTPTSESAIEFVVRKKTSIDLNASKSMHSNGIQPTEELLPYFNQYKIDMAQLKNNNTSGKPFSDSSPL